MKRTFKALILSLLAVLLISGTVSALYEDYSDYTEVDPNGRITINGLRTTWSGLSMNEDAYVYKDFSAGYFAGSFEIQLIYRPGAIAGSAPLRRNGIWSLTNIIDDLKGIDDASGDYLALNAYNIGGDQMVRLYECSAGTEAPSAASIALTNGTDYYISIIRDETVGAQGTLYCYIYTDAARTVQHGSTLSIALSSANDFRYLFSCHTFNSSAPANTHGGYVEYTNLGTMQSSPPNAITYPITYRIEDGAVWLWGGAEDIGDLSSMGFEWGTASGNYSDNATGTEFGAIPDRFYAIETTGSANWTYGETYYYRSYATSVHGTGYGVERSFVYRPVSVSVTTGENFVYGGATGNVSVNLWVLTYPTGLIAWEDAHVRLSTNPSIWSPAVNMTTNIVQISDASDKWMFVSYNGTGSNEGQLVPGVTYYYQGYAVSNNTTYYGAIRSFTPEIVVVQPPPLIELISVEDVSSDYEDHTYAFRLTGKYTEETDNVTGLSTDTINSYGFQWSLYMDSSGLLPLVYNQVVNSSNFEGVFFETYIFDAFNPGTSGELYNGETLYFRAYVTTVNYGDIYSNILSFTPISAGGSGAGDTSSGGAVPPGITRTPWEWLDVQLARQGMDNPGGHWLIIIVLMGLSFAGLYRSNLLRVLVPVCIFGVGLVIGWIDIWVIALLALGAGITVWSMFRKKAFGNGGSE